MEIRFANKEDIDYIAEVYINNHKTSYQGLLSDIYLNGLTLAYGRKKWKAFLENAEQKIWVAYEGKAFLGFGAGRKDSELTNTWYLDSLQVKENVRGQGIGKVLIRAIQKDASGNGYQRMSICIVRGNDRARNLYVRLGAKHFKYFEDDFAGTVSHSEKLVWNELT